MMGSVDQEMLGNMVIGIGKRIRAGKCEMTQEQMDSVFRQMEDAVDIPISKEEACSILGISRSTFDTRVALGQIPEGEHRRGFKEKIWKKREISRLA